MIKKLFLLFIFLFIFFSNVSHSLTIVPQKYNISAINNSTIIKKLFIRNDYKFKSKIILNKYDLIFKNSKKEYLKPSKFSFMNNVDILPNEFILEGNQKKEIDIIINIPEEFTGSYQGAFSITSLPIIDKKPKSNFLQFNAKVMIPFLFEIEGTTSVTAKIKKANVIVKNKSNIEFNIYIQNKGDSNLEGVIIINILDKDYNFLTKMENKKKIIYPYQEVEFKNNLKHNFSKGNYHAIITFVYKNKSVSIDKPFEIIY